MKSTPPALRNKINKTFALHISPYALTIEVVPRTVMLHLLPLEIVSQILLYLDVADIESVLCVDQFKYSLQDKVLLAVDNVYDYRRFPSIKNRCKWTDIHSHSLVIKSMLCIIVVTEVTQYLSPTKLLEGGGLVKYYYISRPGDPKVTITPDSLEKVDLSRNTFFFSELEKVTLDNMDLLWPMLQFPELVSLTLESTTFLPENLNLPKLEKLSLTSCESRDTFSRWNLPLLNELLVTGKFKTINDSIDYGHSTIMSLRLQEITDMEKWSNVFSPSLSYISAEFSTGIQQVTLENLNFSSLEVFRSSANSFKLHQLSFPRVKSFGLQTALEDGEEDEMSYFNAPNLIVFHLQNLQFKTLDHIYTPALVSVDILEVKTVGTHNCDHTFLKGIETMNVISSDWWKHTDSLKLLTVENVRLLYEMGDHYFPHLSNLIIAPTTANTDTTPISLPLLMAPCLEKIEFLGIPGIYDLSGLNHYRDSLESLYLFQSDYTGEIVFDDLYLPSLLVLICEFEFPERFIIQHCKFPELIELELRGSEVFSDQTANLQFSSLELPSLKLLTLSGIYLSQTLDLSKYPLTKICLNHCGGLETIIMPHDAAIDLFEIEPHPETETNLITIYHDHTFDPSKYCNLYDRVDLMFIEVGSTKDVNDVIP